MLNKLSGLSSPPLPFTPLIILSADDNEQDVEALRAAAPRAVVRGGVDDAWTLDNRNRVLVLDRCGRLIYQQTLQQSDTNLQSVQAAVLSAHLDEPCGPCHLPLQQEELRLTNYGGRDQDQEKSSSQAKMSGVANAYASRNVAKPTQTEHTSVERHSTIEETPDNATEETHPETTRKPERKKKKNKVRNKNGKHEKQKKRKRVLDVVVTSTSKPIDVVPSECDCGADDPNVDPRGCECVWGQDIRTQQTYDNDRLDIQVPSSPHTIDEDLASLNEILGNREIGYYDAVRTSTDLPFSRIVWPMDKREKNGKRNRMDLQQEINEGIQIVKEEEELVEYPETIDFYVEVEDNVVAEMEKVDEGHLLGTEEDYKMNHGVGDALSIMGNERANVGHLLGRDDHDLVNHGVGDALSIMGNERANGGHLLGRDDHDLVNHGAGDGMRMEDSIMGNRDHLLGRGDHDLVNHGAGDGMRMEDDILGNEREEGSRMDELGDDRIADLDETYSREQEEDEDEEQRPKEDTVWGTYRRQGEKKDGTKKKRILYIPKKVNKKEAKRQKTMVEADVDKWTGSDEFALRWPAETSEGTVTDGETEARFATWREATIAPTMHDPRSSGDSEDQTRRVVMYESEGGDQSRSWDESVGGKVALLHSKVQPGSKGKHY